MPTRLIYEAAMKTKKVKVREKFIEYSDIEAVEVSDQHCWLCGGETNGQGIPLKKAIKPTFTDHSLSREPGSKSICKACSFCISHRELRNYSILATKKWLMHPGREEIRYWLLSPPEPPFVFCIAKSGQKWLHIRSEVSYTEHLFPVQFEEIKVYVDSRFLGEILSPIEILYSNGFSKKEIESGDYNQKRVINFGVNNWQKFENRIDRYRGERIFSLAVFVAQDQEKLKIKGEKGCSSVLEREMSMKQQALF